jgi:hypothetical protein
VHTNYISFLAGVDQYGVQPPVGFPYRFSVLTWFRSGTDASAPWPLMRLVLPKIAGLVRADTIQAEIWERRVLWAIFKSHKKLREAPLLEWLNKSNDELHEEGSFPSKLRFERKGEVV